MVRISGFIWATQVQFLGRKLRSLLKPLLTAASLRSLLSAGSGESGTPGSSDTHHNTRRGRQVDGCADVLSASFGSNTLWPISPKLGRDRKPKSICTSIKKKKMFLFEESSELGHPSFNRITMCSLLRPQMTAVPIGCPPGPCQGGCRQRAALGREIHQRGLFPPVPIPAQNYNPIKVIVA